MAWARAFPPLGTQNMVGRVEDGAEAGAEYPAVAFGAQFFPGTKRVPGELVYPLAAFSPVNPHHSASPGTCLSYRFDLAK